MGVYHLLECAGMPLFVGLIGGYEIFVHRTILADEDVLSAFIFIFAFQISYRKFSA